LANHRVAVEPDFNPEHGPACFDPTSEHAGATLFESLKPDAQPQDARDVRSDRPKVDGDC
jgi:hypothetical protein